MPPKLCKSALELKSHMTSLSFAPPIEFGGDQYLAFCITPFVPGFFVGNLSGGKGRLALMIRKLAKNLLNVVFSGPLHNLF